MFCCLEIDNLASVGILISEFVDNSLWDLLEATRPHGVVSTSAGKSSYRCGVAKHFSKRNVCFEHRMRWLVLDLLDLTTTAIQVSHNIPLVVFRGGDFYVHDWFKKDRLGIFKGITNT